MFYVIPESMSIAGFKKITNLKYTIHHAIIQRQDLLQSCDEGLLISLPQPLAGFCFLTDKSDGSTTRSYRGIITQQRFSVFIVQIDSL